MERIVKNKRVSKCRLCGKKIDTPYKYRIQSWDRSTKVYFHLTCKYNDALRKIRFFKIRLKAFHYVKRKIKRYKKYMVYENL